MPKVWWFTFFFSELILNRWDQIDGLMQERRNSIAEALELHLSCTYPSKLRIYINSDWFRWWLVICSASVTTSRRMTYWLRCSITRGHHLSLPYDLTLALRSPWGHQTHSGPHRANTTGWGNGDPWEKFSGISIKIWRFSFNEMHLKLLSAKWD